MSSQIIRIAPHAYIVVEDNNRNVSRLVVGPCTYTKGAQETVTGGPFKMTVIPPGHYCIIENPVIRNDAGQPVLDEQGVFQCRWGEREVRHQQVEPFPLYPGEVLFQDVSPLLVIEADTAFRVVAMQNFVDDDGTARRVGERWLVRGPRLYVPRTEITVENEVKTFVIKPNRALKVRAEREFVEGKVRRLAGEEWLVREPGEYFPHVFVSVLETVEAYVLTENTGLHLRARACFTDVYGVKRDCGEEWLVTRAMSATHIIDVNETLVREVSAVTLSNVQFCVIVDPYEGDEQHLGTRKLVRGPCTFFLRPGESLFADTQATYVLGQHDALVLQCNEAFVDTDGTVRSPGQRWLVRGPGDYIPTTSAQVIDTRQTIPLSASEGVYVRDMKTGKVRAVKGKSYMLTEFERLWDKDLPPAVEALVCGGSTFLDDSAAPEQQARAAGAPSAVSARNTAGMQAMVAVRSASAAVPMTSVRREKWRVVTYNVPHNSCVQLFDYKQKRSRVVFGPDMVLLEPDEMFTQLNLSGGMPKRSNAVRSLLMFLGPDFMNDQLIVETSDHARLQIQLGYNWHFRVDTSSEAAAARVFSVPDFVGDACNTLGSRVRAAISSVPFQEFHAHSAEIIRAAVLGDAPDAVFVFDANGLVITNVDVQNVEPVDQRTRDSLQKSVMLAIEITTAAVEAGARNDARKIEQEAIGTLEKQIIEDDASIEKTKFSLLELQAECEAIKTSGQAEAEAQAFAQRSRIEGEAELVQAKLRVQATGIEAEFELDRLKKHYAAEVTHQTSLNELEVSRAKAIAAVETTKFKSQVATITPKVILEMARAGPEMQARLLGGLGLQSVVITDGSNPLSLLGTAQAFMGGAK